MLKFFGSSDIKLYVKNYFQARDDLENKVVVDIPAGTGVNTKVLQEKGARVKAYDLFPEFFDVEGLICEAANHSDYSKFSFDANRLPRAARGSVALWEPLFSL